MGQPTQVTKCQYAAEDSAYGTEGTSYNEIYRVQTSNINNEQTLVYDRGLGEGLNATNAYYAQFDCSGDVSFSVVDFDFLKHWIGNKTGAGTAGDPYILTEATSISSVAAAAGILQPFSFERLNDAEATDSAETLLGCVGRSFTLTGSIGSKLECSANFGAQKSKEVTSGETYTASTDPAFVMLNGTWKWGATPTAISGVRSFGITYNNILVEGDDTRSIESRFQGIPVFGLGRSYNFTVDIIMAQALAATILADFYGQAASSGPVDGSSATVHVKTLEFKIELVNASENANIWLDKCSIDRISRQTQLGGGLVILSFEGTALEGKGNYPIRWWTA